MRPSAPQSHLRYPLTALFGSPGNVRVLRALAAHGSPLSTSQVVRVAGLTPQGTRLVLDGLLAQGVVAVHGQGRSQVFALDPGAASTPPLTALFAWERSRWADFDAAIRDVVRRTAGIRAAWLYGSLARGQDTPGSDVDLAVIVEADAPSGTADALREALIDAAQPFQSTINAVILAPEDLARRAPDDRWFTELTRDAKVIVGLQPAEEARRCGAAIATA